MFGMMEVKEQKCEFKEGVRIAAAKEERRLLNIQRAAERKKRIEVR